MEEISLVFVLSIFMAGVLSFFSPCILPVLPVYVGILSSEEGNTTLTMKKRLFKVLAFVLGISSSFFILGFGAGILGSVLNNSTFFIICGLIIIILGIHQTGLINIPILQREKKLSTKTNTSKGVLGSYLLGFLFSFGWTPCVGPILGAVLGISSSQGGALTGGLLLLVYSLGLGLPFIIVALGAGFFLTKIKGIYKHITKIKICGGILIIIMGVLMITNQVSRIDTNNNAKGDNMKIEEKGSENDFSLNSMDGDTVRLSDLKGKTVYIKFWASWCPSCLGGLEKFKVLANEYKDSKDVVILSIVSPQINGEMSKEDFTSWAKSQDLNFKILFDETGNVNQMFGIRGYPTAVIIGKDGKVGKTIVGDRSNEEIKKTLKEVN